MPESGPGAPAPGAPPLLALGIDYGERRIGIAVGDSLTQSARPVGVVPAQAGKPDWTVLARHVRELGPRVLVVGVPYNMDGTDTRLTQAALEFARECGERYALPVATVDERLSSREAEDILRRQRASGQRKRRVRAEHVDPVAACVLLEQWLRGRAAE